MTIKKILKAALITISIFVTCILLYVVCAYGFARIQVDEEANAKDEIEIFIKTNGVHTDIVFPVKHNEINWSHEIKFRHTKSADTIFQYVGMGWGDKGFYLETPTWADLKVSVAFKAAFGLGETAMHTTYYHTMIENQSCRKIMVSQDQYARLVTYAYNSFKKNNDGHFVNIKTNANYGKTDAFYEANGSYSLLHTCNTWANNALKSAGQKACFWTPFDTGIFLKYDSKKLK